MNINEFQELLNTEVQRYNLDKSIFEHNPQNWTNNKRRYHGFHTIRGKQNKDRKTTFRKFTPTPTPKIFYIMEDIIDTTICEKLKDSQNFEQFVDIKNCSLGDKL